jgi:hypothetical protein
MGPYLDWRGIQSAAIIVAENSADKNLLFIVIAICNN